jgi:hypothetical protein
MIRFGMFAVGLVLASACTPMPSLPPRATIPCTFASETEDAWLHEHCVFTKAAYVRRTEPVDEAAARAKGNEVLSVRNDQAVVKIFRCAERPTWYVAARGPLPGE